MKPAVLCVERQALNEALVDFPDKPGIYLTKLEDIQASSYHFINRAVVDTKNTVVLHSTIAREFPQLLCYITVRNQDQLLSYSRGTGAESRLHAFRSIGLGGHVDLADLILDAEGNINAKSVLEYSAHRELCEELDYAVYLELPDQVKVIVDNSNPVSAVHVGIWVDIIVNDKDDINPDYEISDPQWTSIAQLKQNVDKYEPWSQLIINQLEL